MRVFYIFKINKYFSYVYKNKAYKMYKLLEEIYYLKDYDINLVTGYFKQIVDNFNQEEINRYLYKNLSITQDYYKKSNIHIICDNYEYTKLVVSKDNLKVKTNQYQPSIFNYLTSYDSNIFICDFSNKTYFWLKKDCQKI